MRYRDDLADSCDIILIVIVAAAAAAVVAIISTVMFAFALRRTLCCICFVALL